MLIVLKSGTLNLLEPSGPVQACNGIAVCRLRADCSSLSTCILYCHLQRVTIPEAVIIQFFLLKMSKGTARNMLRIIM